MSPAQEQVRRLSEELETLPRIRHGFWHFLTASKAQAREEREFADRAYLLQTGQVRMTGVARELLGDPAVMRTHLRA